jgi:hypothetical protein
VSESVAVNSGSLNDLLRNRRIERMRLGNQVAEPVPLLSDPSIKFGLRILTEAEYDQCLRVVANAGLPDNIPGARAMDRQERIEILFRSLCDHENPGKPIFESSQQMVETLSPQDIDQLANKYSELASDYSPSPVTLQEDEVNFLNQLFQDFQWKDISGRQLLNLNRFLSSLSPEQLQGNLPGYFSTNS